jgi:predicted HicB family RNase H-like nuclease
MKNLGPYKGYIGSLEFDSNDKILHGKILFIRDIITYEADSANDIENAFHEAVDDYLEDCKFLGVDPDKSLSGTFNVRVSPELHKEISKKSTLLDISLNQYVSQALEYYVHHGEEIHSSIQNLNSSIDELNDCVITIAYQTDRKQSSTAEKFDTHGFIVNALS